MSTVQRFTISRLDYKDCILYALKSRRGVAPLDDVLDVVHRMVADFLTPHDYQLTNSKPFEPRWRNNARWARDALVRDGALLPTQFSGHGTWALSPRGRALAPSERPEGLGHPREGGGRGKHTSTRPAVRGPRHPVAADQFRDLAATLHEAKEAPPGRDANPAMGAVIATLESLLTVCPDDAGSRKAARSSSRSARITTGPRAHRSTPQQPPLTSSSGAGALDTARLTEFIDRRWLPALRSWKGKDTKGIQFAREIEALAALPLLGGLLAFRQGWIPPVEAARLAVRSAYVALGYPRMLGGTVGGIVKQGLSNKRAQALREGILHHVLTAWVQALDAGPQDDTLLLSSALRSWSDELRAAVGNPPAWPSRPEWSWLLGDESDLPAPNQREDELLGLAAWLANVKTRAPRSRLEHGALLWHPNVGWAVLTRQKAEDKAELFPFVVGSNMDYKIGAGLDWIDVDTIVHASPDAAVLEPSVVLVRRLARDSHAQLERGPLP